MPKLYAYLGIMVFFYSNEHEPIHVHGKYGELESKAEIILEKGKVKEIRVGTIKGKRPLSGRNLKNFVKVVEENADDIVKKWVDYFVYHKVIAPINLR